jgi:protocatechuate 3,4-dioxygenase, alpha subunit
MKPTPSQTIGPFFAVALGREEMVRGGSLVVTGRVLDGERAPVADAYLELWDGRRFGRCPTDADGVFSFSAAAPPAGYIAVSVFARGLLQRLATRIYFDVAAAPDASLVARPADGSQRTGSPRGAWRFDIHLQGPEETTFLAV